MSGRKIPRPPSLSPLKARRVMRGETLEAVAAVTGISVSKLKHLEQGGLRLQAPDRVKLARHFGCKTGELSRPIKILSVSEEISPFLDELAALIARKVRMELRA